jgi:CHAT domain-containing protein
MGGEAYVEEQATKARVQQSLPTARVLHLATHGEFRGDNPLFSGLALDDGWLSTLDVYHQQTNATLITLSACQTGQSVVGGGDELLGLMRAFLAIGAASLVLTLWTVHDESTAQLMGHFYQALLAGQPKGAALRHAQVALRTDHTSYAHPHFWGPFQLIGDTGPL